MIREAPVSIGTRVRMTIEGTVRGPVMVDEKQRTLLEVISDQGVIAWLPEFKVDILSPPLPPEPISSVVYDRDNDCWSRGEDGRWRTRHTETGFAWAEVCRYAPLYIRKEI